MNWILIRKESLDAKNWRNVGRQSWINKNGVMNYPKEKDLSIETETQNIHQAKWIGEIEFRDYDELGFWEKRGYSILLNLALMIDILNHLQLDPLPTLNMYRKLTVTRQPF